MPRQLRTSRRPGSFGRRGSPRQRRPSSRGDTNRGTGRRVPQEHSTPMSPFRDHLRRAPPAPKAFPLRRGGRPVVPGRARARPGGAGGAPGAALCPTAARGAAAPPAGQPGALRAPPAPARAPAPPWVSRWTQRIGMGVPADPERGSPRTSRETAAAGPRGARRQRRYPRASERSPRTSFSHPRVPPVQTCRGYHSLSPLSLPTHPQIIHPKRWISSRGARR